MLQRQHREDAPPLTQHEDFLDGEAFCRYTAPRLVRTIVRNDSLRAASEFGSIFTDDEGNTRSYASFFPAALKHSEQLEREELPGYTHRALIRAALADKIEREVLPLTTARWLERYPMRLRTARQTGSYGITLATGRPVVFWDAKAGLSRLCPDDAREEAMRLARRYQPKLEEWTDGSPTHRVTYMVFTRPNSAPGALRQGMQKIFAEFKRVVLQSGEFPAIKGALAVLEAPLGASRDWNVHLNVLVMHDGFVAWGKLRRLWHWNVEMRPLPRTPGAIGAALRELIKYAVAATVAKSEKHDATGEVMNPPASAAPGAEAGNLNKPTAGRGEAQATQRPAAPPMLQWTPTQLLEWLLAFHGHRRTRSYGALFDIELPKAEPVGPVAWLGRIEWRDGRYWHQLALLDSILEDKSALDEGPQDRRTAWPRLLQRLALGSLERYPEVVSINDIYVAKEKNPNWDRDPPRS